MTQFASKNIKTESNEHILKETIKEPVIELDFEMADKISMLCKNIIQEYEQMHNISVRFN